MIYYWLLKILLSLIVNKLKNSNTIFWCGSRGGAAQASHLSAELLGGMFSKKVYPLKSICLNNDTNLLLPHGLMMIRLIISLKDNYKAYHLEMMF